MAENQIINVSPPDNSPPWFKEWASRIQFLLLRANKALGLLTLRDNISSEVLRLNVAHGVNISINHNLGREPQFITLGSGRVQSFEIISTSATRVVLQVYLMSTVTNTTKIVSTSKIDVADNSFFDINDIVLIGTAERKIKSIVADQLLLSDKVLLDRIKRVTLARDVVTFLIL